MVGNNRLSQFSDDCMALVVEPQLWQCSSGSRRLRHAVSHFFTGRVGFDCSAIVNILRSCWRPGNGIGFADCLPRQTDWRASDARSASPLQRSGGRSLEEGAARQ